MLISQGRNLAAEYMSEIRIRFPDDIGKVVAFLAGILWLIYTMSTMSYSVGRGDCQVDWDFPVSYFWLDASVVALWIAIFGLSLRGWTKTAIVLWGLTASFWCILWLGTIG